MNFTAFSVVVMSKQHLVSVDTYSSSAGGWLWTWLVDSVPEVGSSFSLWPRSSSTAAVACFLLVLLGLLAPQLRSRRLPAGAVVAHATDHGNRESDSRCGADRGVLPQIIGNCGGDRRCSSCGCGRPCDLAATWGLANSEVPQILHRAV